MRSSRSHTGPRPLSDFTYIDEDPTNTTTAQNAAYKSSNRSAEPMMSQDYETNYRGYSRMLNSPASPLLLTVTGPANACNHHYTTINTATDNRSPSSNALNQPLSPNHTAQSSNRDNTGNSLLLSSNNLVLPELTKLVHETSI
ncbi:hypothetical protein X777_01795 [Ooceraea biroi]|nr:hypothetical protein X777_01795 [Ooceraea biroi]